MTAPDFDSLQMQLVRHESRMSSLDSQVNALNDVVFGSEFKRRVGMVQTVQEHDEFIRDIKSFNSAVVKIGVFISICMVIIIIMLGYNMVVK